MATSTTKQNPLNSSCSLPPPFCFIKNAHNLASLGADFEENGPMQEGITPMDAVEKLKSFQDGFAMRERKLEMFNAGEELFALRKSNFPAMAKTRKEIQLLDLLYSLFTDVLQTLEGYRAIIWTDLPEQLESMTEVTNAFDLRCKKLPKKLKEWQAFLELRQKITDFQDILPMVSELNKDSVKPRHWNEVIALTSTTFAYDSEVSERSELALMKTSILAMNPAKLLQTATSTNKLTPLIILTRFTRFALASLKMRLASLGAELCIGAHSRL